MAAEHAVRSLHALDLPAQIPVELPLATPGANHLLVLAAALGLLAAPAVALGLKLALQAFALGLTLTPGLVGCVAQ